MSQMVMMTEYRTKPGRKDDLFELFRRLLAGPVTNGRQFVVWSDSATESDASFLFEYWSEAEDFADLAMSPRYVEYVAAVDLLVRTPPITTVTIPRLVGPGEGD